MGINVSRFPYFICMDADSMLQKDSLFEIAKPVLENDKVVACGGQVRISNGIEMVDGEVTKYTLPKRIIGRDAGAGIRSFVSGFADFYGSLQR